MKYSRYHEGVSALDLVRLVQVIDAHQPSSVEATDILEWSRAKFRRVLALARYLGVGIETRRKGGAQYYVLVRGGPLCLAATRRLYDRI